MSFPLVTRSVANNQFGTVDDAISISLSISWSLKTVCNIYRCKAGVAHKPILTWSCCGQSIAQWIKHGICGNRHPRCHYRLKSNLQICIGHHWGDNPLPPKCEAADGGQQIRSPSNRQNAYYRHDIDRNEHLKLISLTFLLGIIFAKTDHGFGIALRTTVTIRPSHVAHGLEALGIIN